MRARATGVHEEYGAGAATPAGYQTAWGLVTVAERRYQLRVESAIKASAAARADAIAKQFQTLRAALPDAARPAATPAAPDVVGAAASAIVTALEGGLSLPKA